MYTGLVCRPMEIETVPKATPEARRVQQSVVDRIARVLEGKASYHGTLVGTERNYATIAACSVRIFGALSCSKYRAPMRETHVVMVCCTATGALASIDPSSTLPPVSSVGGCTPEMMNTIRSNLSSELAQRDGYFNIPLLSTQDAMQSIVTVAFSRSDWSYIEDAEPAWRGREDLPNKLVSRLQASGVCKRYDFTFPIDRLRMRAWAFGATRCAWTGCVVKDDASPGLTHTCTGCKMVKYCSTDCQNRDWPSHKVACKEKKRLDREGRGGAVRMVSLSQEDLEEARRRKWIT